MIRLVLNDYMDKHGITRYELSKRTGILFPVIDNYYKDRIVRYDKETLDRICAALDCSLTDILEYSPNEKVKSKAASRSDRGESR